MACVTQLKQQINKGAITFEALRQKVIVLLVSQL